MKKENDLKSISGKDLQPILDRFDDDMNYFSALFDLIGMAGENSRNFGRDSLTVISENALNRIEALEKCFDKYFERG